MPQAAIQRIGKDADGLFSRRQELVTATVTPKRVTCQYGRFSRSTGTRVGRSSDESVLMAVVLDNGTVEITAQGMRIGAMRDHELLRSR